MAYKVMFDVCACVHVCKFGTSFQFFLFVIMYVRYYCVILCDQFNWRVFANFYEDEVLKVRVNIKLTFVFLQLLIFWQLKLGILCLH